MHIASTAPRGKFFREHPAIKKLVDVPEVTAAVDVELIPRPLTGALGAVLLDRALRAQTFALTPSGGMVPAPAGAAMPVDAQPPPQIVLRDGVLQFVSHGLTGASLLVDAYAPQAATAAGALKVAGIFVTGARAASLWEQQGLSWKSVTTTADAGAQIFELASTMFPALQDHIAIAKVCVIACKLASEADKMGGPARTYFLQASRDDGSGDGKA